MKTSRMQWMLLCAALAVPAAAWAQHGQAPAAPRAPSAPQSPDWTDQELDELVAMAGEGEEWFVDDEGAGGEPGMVVRKVKRGPGRHGGMGMHMRMAKLDLTDAQRTKMRDLHEAAMRKNIQRQADMKIARMDLHKLMRADAPSAQAVNAQIDKMSKLRADGMKAHFETFMLARALLTPEQLKKLNDSPGAGAGPGSMMHHGMGGPGGGHH